MMEILGINFSGVVDKLKGSTTPPKDPVIRSTETKERIKKQGTKRYKNGCVYVYCSVEDRETVRNIAETKGLDLKTALHEIIVGCLDNRRPNDRPITDVLPGDREMLKAIAERENLPNYQVLHNIISRHYVNKTKTYELVNVDEETIEKLVKTIGDHYKAEKDKRERKAERSIQNWKDEFSDIFSFFDMAEERIEREKLKNILKPLLIKPVEGTAL